MKNNINIRIMQNSHKELKILSANSEKSIQFLTEKAITIYLKLTHLARNAGNEYQDIPEAIDKLFIENQKTIEEALKKD